MTRLYKLTGVIFLFTMFITGALLLRFYAVTDVNRRRVSAWYTSKICRLAVRLLGISVTENGSSYLDSPGRLIISNHMSYFDIMIYSSIRPAVFISSVDMRKVPFLGFLAKIGGTFFVERRSPKLIKMEIEHISDLINEGFNVVLFPEGTSTNGQKILPFRSSLLASASSQPVEIVPACLKYELIDGQPFSSENCDMVCWYGDMSFAPHLWNFLKLKQISAKASFFEPLSSVNSSRKELTNIARHLISREYFGAA